MSEERFLKINYGNMKNEISVKSSGGSPASFVPTGVYSIATHNKKIYIPDGLKFSIKVFDSFAHLEKDIHLDKKIGDGSPILFGDILVDSAEIYLTDTLNNMFYIINFNGKLIKKVNFKKITPHITTPSLIFKDNKNRIYISDWNNSKLIIFKTRKLKSYKILNKIENPFVLKNGFIVTTHLEKNNKLAMISLLDYEGKFIGELYEVKEELPMSQIKCLGINTQNSFHFYYKTRGKTNFFSISSTGRFIEKFSLDSGINILFLSKYCIMDKLNNIFKITPDKNKLIINKLVN
jgi:hypothetical protein